MESKTVVSFDAKTYEVITHEKEKGYNHYLYCATSFSDLIDYLINMPWYNTIIEIVERN